MLDWGVFQTQAADNTSGTVTLSADSLTLFFMLLEFTDRSQWIENGEPVDDAAWDVIEAMIANAWDEIS
jgi:hypothetical protein